MTDLVEVMAEAIETDLSKDMQAWVEVNTGPLGIYDDAPAPPKGNYRSTPARMAQAALSALDAAGYAVVPKTDLQAWLDRPAHGWVAARERIAAQVKS